MKIRKAAVAGMFYPRDKEEISAMIDGFLASVDLKFNKEPKALIVPHAGYVYSGPTSAYAYSLLRKYPKKKIILLGPSHTSYFDDVACDVNDYWETPLGKVKVAENDFEKLKEPHFREHCLEVQLPFLQIALKKFEIIPLVAGEIDPINLSNRIQHLLDKNTVLIVSSDLSHFNSYETAVHLDHNTIDAIKDLDYHKAANEGDACGLIPILAAIDLAKKFKWRCTLLDYRNSGDTAGDKSRVVGYASLAFY